MIRPKPLPLLVLALVLAALVYLPGLGGDFVFDDYPNIVQNPAIHAETLDVDAVVRASQAYEPGAIGRPLATLSFALDHLLWGGLEPFGFKLTNLLVHLLNLALGFALLRRVFALANPAEADGAWRPALLIALLWAIHPLQVGTVLYVVQRMEMLAVTSLLLALLAYLRGRTDQIAGRGAGWGWIAASGALAASGLLSKESAVIFPLLTLALELTLLRFAGATPGQARFWRWGYASGTALAAIVFFAVVVPMYAAPEMYAYRDFTLTERLLTQLRVLPMYLGQILLPHPGGMLFNYDHLEASRGLLEPGTTLAGGVFLAALAAAAWWLRHRLPLVALGVMWFFAGHFLTSNVVPLEHAFEHRNYLPLLGVLLALAGLFQRFDQQRAVQGLAVVAVLAFAFVTGIRSLTWGNPLMLAAEHVAVNPLSARASNDLGIQYFEASNHDPASPLYAKAIEEFERGMALPKASPLPEQALILLMATNGQPVKDAWWDSIDRKLGTRPIGPQEHLAMSGLLSERAKGTRFDDDRFLQAWRLLEARGRVRPVNLARFAMYRLRQLDDETEALPRLVSAARADPSLRTQILAALRTEGRDELAARIESSGLDRIPVR